jgi:glycosyltransferase involved in cell wall biosynthesis
MIKSILFSFCFVISSIAAETIVSEPKICLNMIVKNESKAIKKCLDSVRPWIDYWVIVDTGSNDGTQEVIKESLKSIPGELHERPWINFGHNRQEALQFAKNKGDYVLFIDADEILMGALDKSKITGDGYLAKVHTSKEPDLSIQRALLINNHLDWAWKGVLHERLSCPTETCLSFMPQVEISALERDGFRSQDPNKYRKDAEVLEKALVDDPTNAEYVYYLAQSYFNAQEFSLSLKNYQKRATMGGWDQEIFWAKYVSGYLQQTLKMNPEEFIKSYINAFEYRPTRAEPLYRLSNYFLRNGGTNLAYILTKFALEMPIPSDIVYVETWIYSYGLLFEYANSCFELQKYKESATAYKQLLLKSDLPKELRPAIQQRVDYLSKSGL